LLHYKGGAPLSDYTRELALKKVAGKSRSADTSWDEYPFATALEGGIPADVQLEHFK
jgi:hypothetical protein